MSRYVPNTDEQQEIMLKQIGKNSFEELFSDVPEDIRLKGELGLEPAMPEIELEKHMRNIASKNRNLEEYTCFLGAGAYDHYIPAVVNHIISRQEFYTAYTPYQPEISQGTLQAIFEYQTMICELTGMDTANASMYDGATALAEAVAMACRTTGKWEVAVARSVHPEYRHVLATYGRFNGCKTTEIPSFAGSNGSGGSGRSGGSAGNGGSGRNGGSGGNSENDGRLDIDVLESRLKKSDVAAVVVQYPNFFGIIEDLRQIAEIAHKNGALLIVSVDPISLGLLKSPGEQGADIVTGEGQSMGIPLSFGGPYLGFFACKRELTRKMPGRIVGQTTDKNGTRGFVLTLQAREQHIRREKATSNICSNQALNALAATVYLTIMGKNGFKEVAALCARKAHYAYEKLLESGKFERVFSAPFFREFVVRAREPVETINKQLLENRVIGGYDLSKAYPELENCWLIAVTEKRTKEEIDRMVEIAGQKGGEEGFDK